jgi:alpha-tubulin suppressor-like RCC1 family protein
MLQRIVTALVASALLGAVLLIAPAPSAAASLVQETISAGLVHTCALTSAGAAYCWGENGDGRLGDGTEDNRLTPTAVSGSLKFASISAGAYHTCAITSRGAAYCWGYNGDGQLGDGTEDTDQLTPTAVSGGLKFASISAGAYHNCGLTSRGAAYCWGNNDNGQLGDGTEDTDRLTPTAVSGSLKFASISAGRYHTCAITSRGAASCWGNNGSGRLGDGTEDTDRLTPTAVSGGIRFDQRSQ